TERSADTRRGRAPRARRCGRHRRDAEGDVADFPRPALSHPCKQLHLAQRGCDYRSVASSRISIDAGARAARERVCTVVILATEMQGHTHEAARRFAAALRQAASTSSDAPIVILAGGETKLAVTGNGLRGGIRDVWLG